MTTRTSLAYEWGYTDGYKERRLDVEMLESADYRLGLADGRLERWQDEHEPEEEGEER